MLALMALSGAVSFANLFFVDVSITPADEIFADIPARFHVTINKSYISSFFLTLETMFGSLPLPFIRGKHEETLWLEFPQRGRITINDFNIHSGFPLGFFRRFKLYPMELRLLVFPKPITCVLPVPTGGFRGTEKSSESILGELGDEIRELRPYRDSDPLKWVEWKATARTGRMMVREYYHLEGDTLNIDLSKKSDAWEKRLSEACFLVIEAQRRRLLVSLKLPDKEFKAGRGKKHKIRLMEALALA
jgi:uncharacterized protein (DUF58 family)